MVAVAVDQEPHTNAFFSSTPKTLVLESSFAEDPVSPALAEQGGEVRVARTGCKCFKFPAEVTILVANPWMDAGHWVR